MSEKSRILIIDDLADNISMLRPLLKRDYEVIAAESGEEGLNLARAQQPDIILLDLKMPGMDGLDVLRRLRADKSTRDILVIMHTSNDDQTMTHTAIEEGAIDYVVRSGDTHLLLAKLKQYVEQIIIPRKHGAPSVPEMPVSLGRKRVFLSYSSKDAAFAAHLKGVIEEMGYEAWIDHSHIKAGAVWLRSIEEGLKTCSGMVLIMSQSAMASHFVTAEYLAIIRMKKPLIPVLFAPCEIPIVLEIIHRIDYYGNPLNAIEELRRSLKEQIG